MYKKKIVATIRGTGLRKETRSFGATMRSLAELKDWLLENEITHVAMEIICVF